MLKALWRDFVDGLIDNDEKVASPKQHTKTTPYLRPNGQNRYPIYDPNGWKTIPFGTAHTYLAHITDYLPPPPHLGPRATNMQGAKDMWIQWDPWVNCEFLNPFELISWTSLLAGLGFNYKHFLHAKMRP